MARHVNIPIFIPHEGCRNECVFCNQRTITGVSAHDDSKVSGLIEKALSTIEDGTEVEIAFFGGSFTGIGKERMTYLCSVAYDYVKKGSVSSIRLSTRPDYIDEDILSILQSYGVTHIELGIQSMKQSVLDACKRGHTVHDTQNACRLIKEYGFHLGGQMMVGLPHSTGDDEVYTAKKIAELGCDEARIYPCVVFRKTELCNMAQSGTYTPLTIEDAVERCCDVYEVLYQNNVNVLRIGLQSSENLSNEKEIYAGANHPAMGELVMNLHVYRRICKEAERCIFEAKYGIKGKTLIIECNISDISKVTGQKRCNREKIQRLLEKTELSGFEIIPCSDIEKNALNIYLR